jgi:hypothetical protein
LVAIALILPKFCLKGRILYPAYADLHLLRTVPHGNTEKLEVKEGGYLVRDVHFPRCDARA